MTTERINEISSYLAKDVEATKKLLDMDPADAAAKLVEEGFAVTADELIAYGDALKELGASKEGELDEADLENVAGGIAIPTLLLIGIVAGYAASKGKW